MPPASLSVGKVFADGGFAGSCPRPLCTHGEEHSFRLGSLFPDAAENVLSISDPGAMTGELDFDAAAANAAFLNKRRRPAYAGRLRIFVAHSGDKSSESSASKAESSVSEAEPSASSVEEGSCVELSGEESSRAESSAGAEVAVPESGDTST